VNKALVNKLLEPQTGPISTREERDSMSRLASRRWETLFVSLVLIAAFVIRVYELGSFPDTVLADEADNAQDSVRILHGLVPQNGFFGLDWTAQPAFSAYKEAAFIAVLGFNIFAMRLSSALLSTLALLPFYLLLRRQFSIIASMLATVLLATDVWYLNFSRSGWNCIDICFYMLMTMLFLVWGIDAIPVESRSHKRKWIYFAAAGFFAALGLYGYPAGRAITLACIVFLPIALLFYRSHSKTLLLGFGLLFLVEAIVFAPQGLYVAKHWEQFNGRSKVVVIFNNDEFKANPTATMLRQLERNVRGPWDGSVNNTAQYFPVGEPQLDRFTGILVAAGMALSLVLNRLRRRSETWLWWLMLLTGWASTQLFTVGTPNGARGIGYMPTLIYFAAVTLDIVVAILGRIPFQIRQVPILAAMSITALIIVTLFAGYANIKHYVDWQNAPHTRQDRYLYVTAREFSDWSAAIENLARNGSNTMNVGQWREAHSIQDVANPYGTTP
jgi:4-amino-4-deoxy-L-arabinose transferase-like glycosyltransferase